MAAAAAAPTDVVRIRATDLHPPGPAERALLQRTAREAAADRACPACRHAKQLGSRSEPPVLAGMTADGYVPQPPCGGVAALLELSAPLFMAAEKPRRLLRERVPYGLRGPSYSGGPYTLARVQRAQRNASQPLRCRFATCAVVGSSGNLRDRQFGPSIDAHEAVFRVNAAPVIGYERAVGTRTTWRITNSEKPFFLAALGVPELKVAICHMNYIGWCQTQAFGGAYSESVAYVNPVFYSQLWDVLGRPEGKQTPSSGFLAIAVALGVCGRVSIYGFGQRGRPADAGKYYTGGKYDQYGYERSHPFHDFVEEETVRGLWLAAGLVENGTAYGEGQAGAEAVRQMMAQQRPRDDAKAGQRWEAIKPRRTRRAKSNQPRRWSRLREARRPKDKHS